MSSPEKLHLEITNIIIIIKSASQRRSMDQQSTVLTPPAPVCHNTLMQPGF